LVSVRSRADLAAVRRVVVKVGSALLAKDIDGEDPFVVLARQLEALHARGIEVVVVSSGAIALGLAPMGFTERPKDLAGLQAAAAVGQSRLMAKWAAAFASVSSSRTQGRAVAQLLLTHADLRDRRRYLNARQAMLRLLDAGVVPIINENDTVAVEEIKLGDNDTLAAAVCGLVGASAVVLLTGAAGLYTADPGVDPSAVRVPVVHVVDDSVRALAGPAARLGTGGMITKLDAAVAAQRHGAATLIAPGKLHDVLVKLLQGDDIGTLITVPESALEPARKRWIATTLRPKGTLLVDEGAARALRESASLLFAGVREVQGEFVVGDAVAIAHVDDGRVFARGLVRLTSKDARRVAGKKTVDARAQSSEPLPDELVHRDDLVIL
jgi:glutamate 5-kinase